MSYPVAITYKGTFAARANWRSKAIEHEWCHSESHKPFKQNCAQFYDEWLSNTGLNKETDCGKLKAPLRREIVLWILKAWEKLSKEIVQKSFVSCALSCSTDGSKDDEITCFKEGQPCSEGRSMLEKQLEYMSTPELSPFVPDEIDIANACPKELIVDEDHESDEDIDIL